MNVEGQPALDRLNFPQLMNIDSEHLAHLLSALEQSRDGAISGRKLADEFNIDELEIPALIDIARNFGIHLGRTEEQYILVGPPNFLSPREVQAELRTVSFGRCIHHYLQVESTNDVAKQFAEDGAPEGTLILAERQTAGRGRFGRKWFSESSEGIFASLTLRPRIDPQDAPILNLAAAVAVCEAVEDVCQIRADIKWPNDLLFNDRKVCGILAEMKGDPKQLEYLIVGVGINVNHSNFPLFLQNQATSLFLEGGRAYSRIKVLCRFLEAFESAYRDVECGRRSAIIDRWSSHSSYAFGKEVRAQGRRNEIVGKTKGLSETGALRIELSNGVIEEVTSGEVLVWR